MIASLTQVAFTAAAYLPAAAVPQATYPSWLKIAAWTGLVLGLAMLLLMWFGTGLIARAKKGNIHGAVEGSAVAGIGLFWIIVGASGAAISIVSGTIAFGIGG